MNERRRIRVRGAVQGVGFRPFVYRIATERNVAGWVLNDADGVLIEGEGPDTVLDAFADALATEAPVHARIDAIEVERVSTRAEESFEIRPSPVATRGDAGFLPDLATCDACLREVQHPEDRRHRYPFTNCTHCGPRFSITARLPYDRANTTMSRFEMCDACLREYQDPANRRFHAQPNACPKCGPQLSLGEHRGGAALREATRLIAEGAIVAVKGLGGFHLVVNALDEHAIARLRERKSRPTKPFAVMFANMDQLTRYADPSEVEVAGLCSPAAPIVLVRARDTLPAVIAPRNPMVGAVLPYTPLHHILLADVGVPLVVTSGNRNGEPICIDGDEAREVLGDIADAILDHDRPILRPVEDSVMRQFEDELVVLRRGRGLAPSPVVPCAQDGILGHGAQLKTALAISRAGRVVAGPHLGDLTDELRTLRTYDRAVADFEALFEPHRHAVDLHPDIASRRGLRRAVEVQHHHAHAAACLAEHGVDEAVTVVWDGTGYGPDGTIWGGEFLHVFRSGFERIAHLRTFGLVGGEAAIRKPARQAVAVCWELGLPLPDVPNADSYARMLEQGLNCPRTSAAGRLFDAVSALLRLAPAKVSFDGEAAVNLEHAASDCHPAPLPVPELVDGVVDWGPLVRTMCGHPDASGRAAGFIDALAESIARVAATVPLEHVALTGGCFQNRRLLEQAARALRRVDRVPIWARAVPPNDGGIAVGQVLVAAQRA